MLSAAEGFKVACAVFFFKSQSKMTVTQVAPQEQIHDPKAAKLTKSQDLEQPGAGKSVEKCFS